MKGFNFEEAKITQEIIKLGAKRVLLQLPEGFKPEAPRFAKLVESTGAVPIISADPCYGACDLAETEAESVGADLIVHFGHAKMLKEHRVPTLYVEARATVTVSASVELALPLLSKYKRIGLAASVQHLDALKEASEILRRADKQVVFGDSGQMGFAGQVIGCNYSNVTAIADKVDAFLFLGGGMFHGLGVALSTSKPTVIADPYDNRAFSIDHEAQKILKQRWQCIEEAQKAKAFGVIIGLKPGQKHLLEALKIKTLADKHGRAAFLLAAREFTPETVLEFPTLDAYVNTACPRISIDAPGKFSKPVLTINEFMVAVGEASWENMLKKGLFEK